ncbi:hypothetical protein [Lentzea sp. NBRC 102530]|uniref:hypothetical protein n=1 Tax=Lentzea sp. NBRC 102530 TaxID=3032201 RepID=UPI0024A27A77|nr:hypothetical protein [Lentzea sp. NBRC 102530]GLY54824.1 hypothetical protein Lesp01_84790 [Lentzea sp. NBRC 102530]
MSDKMPAGAIAADPVLPELAFLTGFPQTADYAKAVLAANDGSARRINGVVAELYGTWCQHGHHLTVVDPADTSDHPRTIPADPWPCTEGCTVESLEAELEAERIAYEEEREAEYRNLMSGCLHEP